LGHESRLAGGGESESESEKSGGDTLACLKVFRRTEKEEARICQPSGHTPWVALLQRGDGIRSTDKRDDTSEEGLDEK